MESSIVLFPPHLSICNPVQTDINFLSVYGSSNDPYDALIYVWEFHRFSSGPQTEMWKSTIKK